MEQHQDTHGVINALCSLPRNQRVVQMADGHQLAVVNVTWEDTGRTPGSCWGPNITDATLQIRVPGTSDRRLLPVIRKPNFRDITCDVPLDQVRVKVGNHAGQPLRTIGLREYLNNLPSFISDPKTVHGDNAQSLLSARDTHVLVSAQGCILPIPAGSDGKVEFNPVLMNYQSREGAPAVLSILITPDGTSATVLDNTHDKASWGQNVLHNKNGQKTCLTGQRLSAFKAEAALKLATERGITQEEAQKQVAVAGDINTVIVIQVPLVQPPQSHRRYDEIAEATFGGSAPRSGFFGGRHRSFEDAAIGHGKDEGPHFELGGLKLQRDKRFPIRATVQFYTVSDTADIAPEEMGHIAAFINKVYDDARFVGSLVDGTLQKGELEMGEARPTQPAPLKEPVLGPPADLLNVVNPFADGQLPKA